MTSKAYHYLESLEEFECAVRPESNILCFRVKGNEKLQMNIRKRLIANGNFYVTSVLFNQQRYLRLVFMSPHTTISTIENLVMEILNK